MKIVAKIHTDFKTKFGVPRQSGLVKGLKGRIVFEPEFRNAEALRGLEGFSHIWLLWDFSEAHRDDEGWSPTVRPPRLGGNQRMGVWATRSPFRPNNIGLSSVRISKIELHTSEGPVIEVEGADLMDGTPIIDIKPYLPFTDSHPDARGGFAEEQNKKMEPLKVEIPSSIEGLFDTEKREALRGVLAADPRPHYQQDPERIYALEFAGYEVKFHVRDGNAIVTEARPITGSAKRL
jgi:tRNA-Thr(GGU) m(6)t(6)A37 methyltransferase TsaA